MSTIKPSNAAIEASQAILRNHNQWPGWNTLEKALAAAYEVDANSLEVVEFDVNGNHYAYHRDQIIELMKEVEQVRDERSAITSKLIEAEHRIDSLTANNAELYKTFNQKNEGIDWQKREIARLHKECDTANTELNSLKREVNRLHSDRQGMMHSAAAMIKDLNIAYDEIKRLNDVVTRSMSNESAATKKLKHEIGTTGKTSLRTYLEVMEEEFAHCANEADTAFYLNLLEHQGWYVLEHHVNLTSTGPVCSWRFRRYACEDEYVIGSSDVNCLSYLCHKLILNV